ERGGAMAAEPVTRIGTRPDVPPKGLLYSQLGYDAGDELRVVVRNGAEGGGVCRLEGPVVLERALESWGELWGSRWQVASFGDDVPAGIYRVEACGMSGEGLVVGEGRLMRPWREMALDNFERRTLMPPDGPAWNDCGGHMQEAYSHALAVLGLLDLYEHTGEERGRLGGQCRHGLTYLARLQDLAQERGHPDGSLSHDTVRQRDVLLIPNAAKAAACWARAWRVLDGAEQERAVWRRRAERAASYVLNAEPHGAHGFVRHGHGLPPDWCVPRVHRTTDMLAVLWAWVELGELDRALALADEVIARQVPVERGESGLFGHFYTFCADHGLTERAWSHCIASDDEGGMVFGSDGGQAMPHAVLPIALLLRRYPEHPRAESWRKSLESFVTGFLLPACRLNPFGILPLGYVQGEGWLHFAGPWHGFNAVYGWTAALALELAKDLPSDAAELRQTAVNNLQWVAGLNAGLTRDAAAACVFLTFDEQELPAGVAVPVSMIQGFGARSVGGWTTLRGNVANGFAVGEQFKFDVPVTAAEDGPHAYTDEEWIPHAAAYLAGACRL
ncbi:MAG: hypothetical protein AAF797_16645, partial [Planctomycetota bacterium]